MYVGLMEKIVKFFFRLVFKTIKIAESVPVVGPYIHDVLRKMSQSPLFSWILKFKED